jgi:HD-GYP domain-containing protein (c-di-GMP phosphodiesterase class II)
MRYVSVSHLKEGMIIGKPFYGSMNELLLQKGVALSEAFISRIKEMQYSGLYIQDKLSEDIEVKDIISDDLRRNITTEVRRLMTGLDSAGAKDFGERMEQIAALLGELIDEIIASDSQIVDIHDLKVFDLYTYQHSVNVCVLCCVIGTVLQLNRRKLYNLGMAALLHDIGKMFVDKDILNKPGKLTHDEFEIMKQHSILGYQCLKGKAHLPGMVTVPILQHHEKYNGLGYPDGLKGSEISLFAQIISVADVYDAITSKRPYHDAILPSEAYEFIMGNAGISFAPEVVDVFTKNIAPFPLGAHVQLSNGLTGIVYKNYDKCLTRPLIKLEPQPDAPNGGFVDLQTDPKVLNLTIQRVLT